MNDESFRLNTLRLYRILDTTTEKAFDDITQLASTVCGTPISLVSLVDEERQWFKSRQGLGATWTPRNQAFCDHAIRYDQVMVVEDAQADERFVDNPLVTDEPNIRFYAGAPLTVSNGARLGTLCVIDTQPRTLTPEQEHALHVLRDAAVAQLELRRAAIDMQALHNLLPMCAWCRSVRTDSESSEWRPLHEFVAGITEVTHSICPACKEQVQPTST